MQRNKLTEMREIAQEETDHITSRPKHDQAQFRQLYFNMRMHDLGKNGLNLPRSEFMQKVLVEYKKLRPEVTPKYNHYWFNEANPDNPNKIDEKE